MPTQRVLNKIVVKDQSSGLSVVYKIGNILEGYLNPSDGKFYEESTYITEIEAASDFIYIDLNDNNIYRYDITTEKYINIGGQDEPLSEEQMNDLLALLR